MSYACISLQEANIPTSSCPGLSRASTSLGLSKSKTWMAGTSPAMTVMEPFA